MQFDLFTALSNFFKTSGNLSLRWTDVLDILVVALVIYWILKLIKGTFAVQIITGLALLLVASMVSRWAGLRTVNMLLANFWGFGLLVFLIIFQPEIRRTIAQIGKYGLMSYRRAQQSEVAQHVIEAALALAQTKTGALIVIERNTGLRSHIEHGVQIGAEVSPALIRAIFQQGSPLHDGAVIISGGRIACAATFLPLTRSLEVESSLGSRHRAAMGITEDTDAVAVLVSEETGGICISVNGKLTKEMAPEQFRTALHSLLAGKKRHAAGFARRHEARPSAASPR